MTSVLEKVIYLDSRDADTYLATKIFTDNTGTSATKILHSYCAFNLIETIAVPENMDIEVSLNSATIPYSFYNIRVGVNDRINYEVYEKTGAGAYINPGTANFAVPEGNYSALSLAVYLSTALDNKTGSENPLATHNYNFDYTQNWNTDIGKFEFGILATGASAGKNLQFRFLIDEDLPNTMITELGLDPIDTFFAFEGLVASDIAHQSPNFVDVNGNLHGLFIRTNLTSSNTMESQSKTFSNILSRIPITSGPGQVIFKEPANSGHKSVVQTKAISEIVIKLTDDRNNLLDLNGLHFQVSVQFNYVYHIDIAPILTRDQAREKAESNIYNVVSDNSAQQKISAATQQISDAGFVAKNKGGRPRKVGRPKGSTKIKD